MADDIEKPEDFEDDAQNKAQPINFDDIPDIMPLLPVRDVVIYSYMILPLMVGREKSIRAVEQAVAGNRLIFWLHRSYRQMKILIPRISFPSAQSQWSSKC